MRLNSHFSKPPHRRYAICHWFTNHDGLMLKVNPTSRHRRARWIGSSMAPP